jgi:hypothetical protein
MISRQRVARSFFIIDDVLVVIPEGLPGLKLMLQEYCQRIATEQWRASSPGSMTSEPSIREIYGLLLVKLRRRFCRR